MCGIYFLVTLEQQAGDTIFHNVYVLYPPYLLTFQPIVSPSLYVRTATINTR